MSLETIGIHWPHRLDKLFKLYVVGETAWLFMKGGI